MKQTPYSMGYNELGYATNNKISYGTVQNRSGQFVECTAKTISSAASSATMPKDFRVSIVNPLGQDVYPVPSFTWLLVYQQQTDRTKGEALIKFLKWMLNEGQKYTEPLGYAPLPQEVIRLEEEAIGQIQLP